MSRREIERTLKTESKKKKNREKQIHSQIPNFRISFSFEHMFEEQKKKSKTIQIAGNLQTKSIYLFVFHCVSHWSRILIVT